MLDLLKAAHKYQVPMLSNICTKYLKNHLTVATVADVLKVAADIDSRLLRKCCVTFISEHVDEVCYTPGWKRLTQSGLSIADVLDMTLDTKCNLCAAERQTILDKVPSFNDHQETPSTEKQKRAG